MRAGAGGWGAHGAPGAGAHQAGPRGSAPGLLVRGAGVHRAGPGGWGARGAPGVLVDMCFGRGGRFTGSSIFVVIGYVLFSAFQYACFTPNAYERRVTPQPRAARGVGGEVPPPLHGCRFPGFFAAWIFEKDYLI